MLDGERYCALVLEVRGLASLDIDGTHHQMNLTAVQSVEIDQLGQGPAKRCRIIDAGLQEWRQEWGVQIGWADPVHGRVGEQRVIAFEHRWHERPIADGQTFPPYLINGPNRVVFA